MFIVSLTSYLNQYQENHPYLSIGYVDFLQLQGLFQLVFINWSNTRKLYTALPLTIDPNGIILNQ
jgi:hypothetical protein